MDNEFSIITHLCQVRVRMELEHIPRTPDSSHHAIIHLYHLAQPILATCLFLADGKNLKNTHMQNFTVI